MKYSCHITITGQKLKSLNKSLNSSWYAQRANGKRWDKVIAIEFSKTTKPKEPLQKAHITFIRHSSRTLDFDGLVGALKPVMDAIVDCGVVIDDKWTVVGQWTVDQKFRPRKDGEVLEIIIQEL